MVGQDTAGDHARQRLAVLAAGPGGAGKRACYQPKRAAGRSRYTRPFRRAARDSRERRASVGQSRASAGRTTARQKRSPLR
jgi:hypothetical protein